MKKTIISSAILSVLSFGAMAETPSFNYVDFGYVSDFSSDESFDGFEFRGNFEINDNFYVSAGIRQLDVDLFGIDADADFNTIGFGYKKAITSNSVFYTQLDYVNTKATVSGFGSNSDNGYQVGFGMRSNLSSNFEVKAGVNYIDAADSNTYMVLGGVYSLSDNVGLYFDIESDFDDSNYSTGVRFSF
jgi:opacity protein-like surface antigen